MIKIYGIPNCDTVRKAVKWLEANNIEHEFINYRKEQLPRAEIEAWDKAIGWEAFLNKRSTAWKPLEQSFKDSIVKDGNRENALEIMLEKETLIKRPVLVKGEQVFLGFKPEMYQDIFAEK